MIFIDKLLEFEKVLNPEIKRLFFAALKAQTFDSDVLLIHLNGSYNKDTLTWNEHPAEQLDPHGFGPGHEGHSESAHYSFLDKYRRTHIFEKTLPEYLKLHEYSPERKEDIEKWVDIEETTIQLEMLIYLKFWEADLIIKKLYQFVRILNGEHYDWYLSFRNRHVTTPPQDLGKTSFD